MQNSPHSHPPLVVSISSAIASSRRSPYRFRNSVFTRSRCRGSQCSRTRRDMSSSERSLPVRDSRRAWFKRSASRMGRFSAPLRTCASVSPCHAVSCHGPIGKFEGAPGKSRRGKKERTYNKVARSRNHCPREVLPVHMVVCPQHLP